MYTPFAYAIKKTPYAFFAKLTLCMYILCGNVHSQKRHRLVASCQFYWLVTTCQQDAAILSISSSCNKSVKTRLVATCHLQTCCLQTCNNSVDNLQQSCRKPCERILISARCNKLLQDVNRIVTTCAFFGCVNESPKVWDTLLTFLFGTNSLLLCDLLLWDLVAVLLDSVSFSTGDSNGSSMSGSDWWFNNHSIAPSTPDILYVH